MPLSIQNVESVVVILDFFSESNCYIPKQFSSLNVLINGLVGLYSHLVIEHA